MSGAVRGYIHCYTNMYTTVKQHRYTGLQQRQPQIPHHSQWKSGQVLPVHTTPRTPHQLQPQGGFHLYCRGTTVEDTKSPHYTWRMSNMEKEVVEAHCYAFQCKWIDCELLCSSINKQLIAARFDHVGLCQLCIKLFHTQLTKVCIYKWTIPANKTVLYAADEGLCG